MIFSVIILIVLVNTINHKPRCKSVTNTHVNPTLFVIPCKFFWWALQIYSVVVTVTYHVIFHPNFNHSWQYFFTSCWQEKEKGYGQWMNSSIIHDNICSLIHKKCHLKSHDSDIKNHMALISYLVWFPMSMLFSLFSMRFLGNTKE